MPLCALLLSVSASRRQEAVAVVATVVVVVVVVVVVDESDRDQGQKSQNQGTCQGGSDGTVMNDERKKRSAWQADVRQGGTQETGAAALLRAGEGKEGTGGHVFAQRHADM